MHDFCCNWVVKWTNPQKKGKYRMLLILLKPMLRRIGNDLRIKKIRGVAAW